jgi:hypothetical protein
VSRPIFNDVADPPPKSAIALSNQETLHRNSDVANSGFLNTVDLLYLSHPYEGPKRAKYFLPALLEPLGKKNRNFAVKASKIALKEGR